MLNSEKTPCNTKARIFFFFEAIISFLVGALAPRKILGFSKRRHKRNKDHGLSGRPLCPFGTGRVN